MWQSARCRCRRRRRRRNSQQTKIDKHSRDFNYILRSLHYLF